jgi:hypothetical protein
MAGQLHLTSRGRLALAVAAVVVALVIAQLAGVFSGSKAKPSALKPTATGSVGASPPAAAGTSTGASTTTSVAPTTTHHPTVVHNVVATTSSWHLPAPLSRSVVLPVTGGLEVLGGLLNGDHSASAVRRIALPAGTVTSDGTLSPAVHDAAGAAYKDGLYVYAGGAASEVAGVQKAVSGSTATTAGSLPAPRSDLVAVQVAGKVLLIGGYDGVHTLADVLVSSDGVHFTVLTRLPVPVRYPAAVVRNGQVFVYGGDVSRKPVDDIQRIDVAAGTATVVGHLPEPISHQAGLVFGTSVWLLGGTTPTGTSGRMWRSDDGVRFTRAGSLPQPRSDAGVAMSHGVGYLVGGEGAHRFDTVVTVKPG